MKVAFVSTLLPETNYFCYLAKALQDEGVDLRVYADRKADNLKVGLKKVHLLWSQSRLYPFHILRQALRDSPDVIHLHHEVGMFGGPTRALVFPLLPFLLWLFRFRVVTTIHAVIKPSDIDKRFLETFAWPPRAFLVPLIKIYFFLLNWVIILFSKRVIVHSEYLKDILAGDYRCPVGKVVVIAHGAPDKVKSRKSKVESDEWGLAGADFILYFGYFHRRKGLETLIDAYKILVTNYQLPITKLVLAGGALQPDYPEVLKKLAREKNLENRIIFTGFVSEVELRWLLENCLFVVLPATYSISASGPLAQVVAHEKPVIVTRLGVFSAEIEEGETGLFCQPGNAQDLAKKMKLILADEGLRKKLSTGVKRLHEERRWSKIAQETINLYHQMLAG